MMGDGWRFTPNNMESKLTSRIVKTIHNHAIEYCNLDEYSELDCKCGEKWYSDNAYILHADHVALKVLETIIADFEKEN